MLVKRLAAYTHLYSTVSEIAGEYTVFVYFHTHTYTHSHTNIHA